MEACRAESQTAEHILLRVMLLDETLRWAYSGPPARCLAHHTGKNKCSNCMHLAAAHLCAPLKLLHRAGRRTGGLRERRQSQGCVPVWQWNLGVDAPASCPAGTACLPAAVAVRPRADALQSPSRPHQLPDSRSGSDR